VLERLSAVAAKLDAGHGRGKHESPRPDPELDQFMVYLPRYIRWIKLVA
jgi:hypothetical protein